MYTRSIDGTASDIVLAVFTSGGLLAYSTIISDGNDTGGAVNIHFNVNGTMMLTGKKIYLYSGRFNLIFRLIGFARGDLDFGNDILPHKEASYPNDYTDHFIAVFSPPSKYPLHPPLFEWFIIGSVLFHTYIDRFQCNGPSIWNNWKY